MVIFVVGLSEVDKTWKVNSVKCAGELKPVWIDISLKEIPEVKAELLVYNPREK